MPLRPAHEVDLKPAPRCPVCGVGVTASGLNQPVAVDEQERPYCRRHGHTVAPDYDARLAEYERARAARKELLEDAAAQGVAPSEDEIAEIRREWAPAAD